MSPRAAERRLFAPVPTPVLHVCGDTRDAFRSLAGAGAAVLDIEGSRIESWPSTGASELRAAGLKLALGCIDTHTDAVESLSAIRAWIALACRVTGTLDRVDRVTQFTGFTIHASLELPADTSVDQAQGLLERAEQGCLIANSLKGAARLETKIEVAPSAKAA